MIRLGPGIMTIEDIEKKKWRRRDIISLKEETNTHCLWLLGRLAWETKEFLTLLLCMDLILTLQGELSGHRVCSFLMEAHSNLSFFLRIRPFDSLDEGGIYLLYDSMKAPRMVDS